jgi:hypothetical protein
MTFLNEAQPIVITSTNGETLAESVEYMPDAAQ